MRLLCLLLFIAQPSLISQPAHAGFDAAYVIHRKHSNTPGGYFSTPHQLKAKTYWDQYQIIDNTHLTTIPVATQVGFAASTETADVYVPENYESDKPIGIYIHMNSEDNAYMPAAYYGTLGDLYCIGASPDNAGNNRHDPWRIARALDLVASLKDRYNVDEDRVYIGGFSGGALISIMTGMLYPDVFKGVAPTEHMMASQYWSKVFTSSDMSAMAASGQRWAFITGATSYAYDYMTYNTGYWKNTLGFKSMNTIVPGMAHNQPPAGTLKDSIAWIDAPVQRQRCRTYNEWVDHCFDSSHRTTGRGALDDYDLDGKNNLMEYVLGCNPVVADNDSSKFQLHMQGKQAQFYFRRASIDTRLLLATSPDLSSWDETGTQISETSTSFDSEAFARCTYQSSSTSPILFFKAQSELLPLINLTQLSGTVALQSTTAWGGLASRAIDGVVDSTLNGITHTDDALSNWLRVFFVAPHPIHRITLYNRDSFQGRLANFRISILDGGGVEVAGKNFYTTSGNVANFMHWDPPNQPEGRSIRISTLGPNREGNHVLSFAEVEVLGPNPAP